MTAISCTPAEKAGSVFLSVGWFRLPPRQLCTHTVFVHLFQTVLISRVGQLKASIPIARDQDSSWRGDPEVLQLMGLHQHFLATASSLKLFFLL